MTRACGNGRRGAGSSPRVLDMRVVSVMLALLLFVGACGSATPGTPGTRPAPDPTGSLNAEQTPWDWALASPTAPDARASADPSPECDPVDRLFLAMLAGISAAALSTAGIDRKDFLAALAGDRELLRDYLARLGVNIDEAELDALIGAYVNAEILAPGSVASAQPSSAQGPQMPGAPTPIVPLVPWAGCG